LRIIGVSAAVCAVASLVLLLIPRHATRAASQLLAETADRPDTMLLVQRAADTRVAVVVAESALGHARARALAPRPTPEAARVAASDTTAAGRAHRDSLLAVAAELDQLLTRAEGSPLPSSYRALGGATALTGMPRVQVLLDSLSDVARARDAFDAAGGVDPIFVALTGRVNAIGQAIQSIAASRRAVLRAAIARSTPPPQAAPRPASGDTVRLAATADSARRALDATLLAFARARARDADLDARAAQARAITDQSASPIALAGAALVLGLALGFAMTFGAELRRPRVADGAEAERVAGVPILATITPRRPDPFRARRAADRLLSPLIDASAETYRVIYANVSDPQGTSPMAFPFVAVTGDEAAIVATVATNLAVAAINDSRSALLIDADPDAGLVAGIMSVPREPGVADVLAGRSDWAGATVPAPAGRDRMLAVIPAGRRRTARRSSDGATREPDTASPSESHSESRSESHSGSDTGDTGDTGEAASAPESKTSAREPRDLARGEISRGELRAELLRLGRRYELIVVAAPPGAPHTGSDSILPVSDAVVCARVAFTTLTRLAASVAVLQDSGLRVRGIVLWDADSPPRV
jgi:Mrp family chromosome partitioning ATPase